MTNEPRKPGRGLGRGLDALLPSTPAPAAAAPPVVVEKQRTYFQAQIEDVYPAPDQPRRRFVDAELDELAQSIRAHGIIMPLVVRPRPGGGYTLGRKASEITVADIIVSVDEPIDATQCGGKENCQGDGGRCMTHELWAALNQRMVEFLDSISLQKLVDDQLAKGIQIEDKPTPKRAISSAPVVKPIRVNAPNSVFALGNTFAKQ